METREPKAAKQQVDIFANLTKLAIQHLENGKVPWRSQRSPWLDAGQPRNLISKTGIVVLILYFFLL